MICVPRLQRQPFAFGDGLVRPICRKWRRYAAGRRWPAVAARTLNIASARVLAIIAAGRLTSEQTTPRAFAADARASER